MEAFGELASTSLRRPTGSPDGASRKPTTAQSDAAGRCRPSRGRSSSSRGARTLIASWDAASAGAAGAFDNAPNAHAWIEPPALPGALPQVFGRGLLSGGSRTCVSPDAVLRANTASSAGLGSTLRRSGGGWRQATPTTARYRSLDSRASASSGALDCFQPPGFARSLSPSSSMNGSPYATAEDFGVGDFRALLARSPVSNPAVRRSVSAAHWRSATRSGNGALRRMLSEPALPLEGSHSLLRIMPLSEWLALHRPGLFPQETLIPPGSAPARWPDYADLEAVGVSAFSPRSQRGRRPVPNSLLDPSLVDTVRAFQDSLSGLEPFDCLDPGVDLRIWRLTLHERTRRQKLGCLYRIRAPRSKVGTNAGADARAGAGAAGAGTAGAAGGSAGAAANGGYGDLLGGGGSGGADRSAAHAGSSPHGDDHRSRRTSVGNHRDGDGRDALASSLSLAAGGATDKGGAGDAGDGEDEAAARRRREEEEEASRRRRGGGAKGDGSGEADGHDVGSGGKVAAGPSRGAKGAGGDEQGNAAQSHGRSRKRDDGDANALSAPALLQREVTPEPELLSGALFRVKRRLRDAEDDEDGPLVPQDKRARRRKKASTDDGDEDEEDEDEGSCGSTVSEKTSDKPPPTSKPPQTGGFKLAEEFRRWVIEEWKADGWHENLLAESSTEDPEMAAAREVVVRKSLSLARFKSISSLPSLRQASSNKDPFCARAIAKRKARVQALTNQAPALSESSKWQMRLNSCKALYRSASCVASCAPSPLGKRTDGPPLLPRSPEGRTGGVDLPEIASPASSGSGTCSTKADSTAASPVAQASRSRASGGSLRFPQIISSPSAVRHAARRGEGLPSAGVPSPPTSPTATVTFADSATSPSGFAASTAIEGCGTAALRRQPARGDAATPPAAASGRSAALLPRQLIRTPR
eukprot:TRINITY_DN16295_c0_g5_i1.p1 TRINITY_DN16295_c0_g5~~TRINITY_DN16295_c0_g5_i1.p1  ORF type:complete len:924 (+),score=177.49 TRINITY_DN16295_c0_g5_i1:119-2890(+)